MRRHCSTHRDAKPESTSSNFRPNWTRLGGFPDGFGFTLWLLNRLFYEAADEKKKGTLWSHRHPFLKFLCCPVDVTSIITWSLMRCAPCADFKRLSCQILNIFWSHDINWNEVMEGKYTVDMRDLTRRSPGPVSLTQHEGWLILWHEDWPCK